VVVDIPKDVSFKKALYTGYPEKVEMRSYNPVKRAMRARSARRCSCC
jgi:acetolactate synthase-1/2/3 large subunit